MSPARPVRGWGLADDLGEVPLHDVADLGPDGPPLFEDPWEVLEEPQWPASVSVLSAATAAWGATDDAIRGVARVPGSATPDRHPPTLLVERRRLAVPEERARSLLARRPPAAPGQAVLPGHRVVESPHGPVTLLSTRPWGGRTGPDVRVVAIIVPDSAADAMVFTLTWDDEHGLAVLEALAERIVAGLEIELGAPHDPGAPTTSGGRTPAPAFGQAFPPPGWVGTRAGGSRGRAADRLTGVVRKLFGTRRFRRATVTAWLSVAVLAAVFTIGWEVLGAVLLVAAFVLCLVMPTLLVWRAWTVAHGLVTDPREFDPASLPGAGTTRGLIAYGIAAAALGGLVLATALDGAPWWYLAAGWYYVVTHAALLALEAGLRLAPAVRDRLARRGQ